MPALIALALLFSAAAQAQDAGYELTGYVVASGSAINGGEYAISGALGQADTGTLSGGDCSLGSGFFGGGMIRWRDAQHVPADDNVGGDAPWGGEPRSQWPNAIGAAMHVAMIRSARPGDRSMRYPTYLSHPEFNKKPFWLCIAVSAP